MVSLITFGDLFFVVRGVFSFFSALGVLSWESCFAFSFGEDGTSASGELGGSDSSSADMT